MKTQGAVYRTAVISLVVLGVLLGGATSAFASNADCLTCHETDARGQEFQVIDVDRDTVCSACHIPTFAGTHPVHQPGSNCGAICHDDKQGWGNSLLTATPYYSDSAGAFSSATSKDAPASVLHIIHSTPRWPAGIDTADSRCASCHSAAACDACHVNDPSSTHATHGNETPWSGQVGRGVSGGDQKIFSVEQDTNSCGSAGCHDVSSTQGKKPHLKENFSHSANPSAGYSEGNVVTTTGYWRTRYSQSHTYARMSYSNDVGATLAVTFNGTRVELVADRDPYRGMGEVRIDGVLVATVDLYAPTTTYQATVFESDTLSSGLHTIEVTVLGTKDPAARAAYFSVDAFEVYAELPDTIAPDCVTCHVEQASNHGGSFDHVATQTVDASYPSTAITCTQCHSMSMWVEHTRSSSKTKDASCTACHTTYADYSLDTYGGTCAESPCHQASNGQDPHNFTDASALIDASHVAPENAATAECRACHGSDLSVIHDDSNASRPLHASLDGIGSTGPDFVTSCLTCHGTDAYPTTANCTDSGCHVGSGVVSMATHPAPAHDGTNSNAGVDRAGSLSCSTCHLLELTAEHGKASSVTDPGGAAIGCPECHSAAYFPNGWLDTAGTTNTCNACHDPAGAADAGLPHEASEYTAKHDWSATNGSSGTSENCSNSLCHNVAAIDAIHTDPWNATVTSPRGSSCESCHDDPTAVPTETDCLDCHTGHTAALVTAHDPQATPAMETANADCLACHAKFDAVNDNGLILHGGMCYTCHNKLAGNRLDQYLMDNYTAACQDCHNASASYDYQPYDPNHYDPYLASHTANYGGDSVPTSGTVVTEKACVSCHANSLKAEHALTLSSGEVNCIDCHSSTTPINAAAQVAANWTNDKCADCHGTNHGGTGLASHVMTASATSLGCSVGGCHDADTGDLAKLHADADNGATSCNVCHSTADTSLTAISGCDSCHTGHDLTVHEVTTDTGNCLRCHEKADGSAASDIRDVHPDCATCHDNSSYPNVTTGKTSNCVSCHAAGIVAEPHAGSGGDYDTYDPNHYVGTETTHTAAGTDSGFSNTDGKACVSCHLLEMKPEHFKATSVFASVPGTYADKCVGCHEVAVDTISGAWDDSCLECHTTGSTHTAFNTAHDAPAAYDTSCGGGGCHDTDNADLIHKNSVASNATVTTCLNTCHLTNTDLPASVNCDTSGCHAGGHGHALDLAGSDYDNAAIEGCTNAGAGCHGTSAETDYTAYHPASGCSTGACHDATALNHDNAQFDGEITCQNCHGGGTLLYTNAPDTVGLVEPIATGHYAETLHDIGAFLGVVKGTTSGQITATCNDCHSRDGGAGGMDGLWVQHQGLDDKGDVTCTECHNAFAAVVADNWSTPSCGDCHSGAVMSDAGDPRWGHVGGVAPVGINGSGSGCVASGCHLTWDLHELHEGNGVAPEPACSTCHDYSGQGAKPTITSCADAACHVTDAHDPNAHDASSQDSGSCIDCHENDDIRVQHSNNCGLCHNASTNLGSANTADCVDCHNSTDMTAGDGYTGDGYGPYDPTHYDNHTASHTEADDIINGVTWGTANYSRTLDYYYTGGTTADTTNNAYNRPCGDCHTTDLYTEHTKSTIDFALGVYADECVACHETIVDSWGATAWDKTCSGSTDCHDVTAANLHYGSTASLSWTSKHDATNWTLTSAGSDYTDTIGGAVGGGGPTLGAGFSDGFESSDFTAWTSADQSGSGGTTVIFSDDFETGNLNAWDTVDSDWSASNATVNGGAHAGSWYAEGANTSNSGTLVSYYLTKNVDLSGLSGDATLTWWQNWGGCETADFVYVEYYSGGSWSTAYTLTGVTLDAEWPGWTQQSVTIPQAATAIRYHYRMNFNTDIYHLDDVTLTGPAPATPGGWDVQTAQKSAGTYGARAVGTGTQWYDLTKTGIDNANAATVDVSYAIRWDNLESADAVVVQYTTNNGGAWTDIRNYAPAGSDPSSQAWKTETFTGLPASINGVRFRFNADSQAGDLLYIDAVTVTPRAAGGGAGSAGASCSNNPNGYECHNVTDVADIHAQLANDGCSVCHTDNTDHPTVKNCQASGCHVGVDIDEHDAHHDTNFVSASFDTAFDTAWCESCHIGGTIGGIDDEHEVLDAYDATPCSMCHKKEANTGGAAAVTQANTISAIDTAGSGNAICEDCHASFSKEVPHVQRNVLAENSKQFDAGTGMTGHRVYASNNRNPWMETAWEGYSIGAPTIANFLVTAWRDTSAMVTCDDCHSSATPAAPHAGTMQINNDPAYSGFSSTLAIDVSSNGMSQNAICAKCHDIGTAWSNNVHTEHEGRGSNGGYCVQCHPQIPHQSTHVRMLAVQSDGPMGTSTSGGMTGIRPHNETPNGWDKADCGAECATGRHPYNHSGHNPALDW